MIYFHNVGWDIAYAVPTIDWPPRLLALHLGQRLRRHVLPLLLAFGAGANARFAIGLMIAAGMLVGTLFTLFVVPAVYMVLARDHAAADEARAEEPVA